MGEFGEMGKEKVYVSVSEFGTWLRIWVFWLGWMGLRMKGFEVRYFINMPVSFPFFCDRFPPHPFPPHLPTNTVPHLPLTSHPAHHAFTESHSVVQSRCLLRLHILPLHQHIPEPRIRDDGLGVHFQEHGEPGLDEFIVAFLA